MPSVFSISGELERSYSNGGEWYLSQLPNTLPATVVYDHSGYNILTDIWSDGMSGYKVETFDYRDGKKFDPNNTSKSFGKDGIADTVRITDYDNNCIWTSTDANQDGIPESFRKDLMDNNGKPINASISWISDDSDPDIDFISSRSYEKELLGSYTRHQVNVSDYDDNSQSVSTHYGIYASEDPEKTQPGTIGEKGAYEFEKALHYDIEYFPYGIVLPSFDINIKPEHYEKAIDEAQNDLS